MNKASKEVYDGLPTETRDIYSKYDESQQFLQKRKTRQVNQIVLLNNLQRGDENIASTLLITLFNRILSNLYDDKMQVKFVPSEELDQRKINSINILAQNDYREMDKQKLDYDWDWDTLFFGRGYMETLRFDKERKIMQPHVINPLVFGYDPFFHDVQDWRYYWKWILKSSVDINKLIKAKVITGITDAKQLPSGVDPQLWDYEVKRQQAKDAQPQANDTYQGDVHQILEFFGYNAKGEKCVYWLDRNFSKILYYEKLDLRDGPKKESKWPLVVKEAFREPHSSVVFSVADLLEDKHRARSVLLNLAFIAAKDKANPLYQFDPDKVRDLSQLFNRQINQHIPVTDVQTAIAPLNTQNPMDAGLAAFMQILSQEANDPVGTGMALSPAKKKGSATEQAIQQQLNDLAQSLQSKIMQFGEAEFWSHWYQRYKRYTKEGDTKIATIVGVKGLTFETINLKDIHTKYPPGCLVFSAKEAEYKELVLRRDLAQFRPQLQESLGPEGIRLFDKHVLLPKYLHDPTLLDILIPKSFDEIKAEEENEQMNQNDLAQVQETDDHTQHLLVHRMAQNTWAKWVHIAWHEELLGEQRKMEQQQQQEQMQEGGDKKEGGDKPKADRKDRGSQKKDSKEAASPVKQEMSSQTSNSKDKKV
jgi:hypothetical protein